MRILSGKWSINLRIYTLVMLLQYRADQELLRIQMGVLLKEDDFVFAKPDGMPLEPSAVTSAFRRINRRAGLVHIRVHDLRHTQVFMPASALP